jgi:hypothetical protein
MIVFGHPGDAHELEMLLFIMYVGVDPGNVDGIISH